MEAVETPRPRHPVALRNSPLVEAIVELRFAGSRPYLGDLLPGLLFPALGSRFPGLEPLAIASLPREFRSSEPQFRYQPLVRLAGTNEAVLIGDHVVLVSRLPPYDGWPVFRDLVLTVVSELDRLQVIGEVERFSFKCVNLIEFKGGHPLGPLSISLTVPGLELTNTGFRLRAEASREGFTSIVDITSSVTLETRGVSREGVLLSLDAIKPISSVEFWASTGQHIDAAHSVVKDVFFGLLADQALESLLPDWGQS